MSNTDCPGWFHWQCLVPLGTATWPSFQVRLRGRAREELRRRWRDVAGAGGKDLHLKYIELLWIIELFISFYFILFHDISCVYIIYIYITYIYLWISLFMHRCTDSCRHVLNYIKRERGVHIQAKTCSYIFTWLQARSTWAQTTNSTDRRASVLGHALARRGWYLQPPAIMAGSLISTSESYSCLHLVGLNHAWYPRLVGVAQRLDFCHRDPPTAWSRGNQTPCWD